MPEKIELKFICLSESRDEELPSFILLGEENSDIRIPILIGESEAKALSMTIKGIKNCRPTANDLFVDMANCFGITLKEVFIYYYEEGVYRSELVMEKGDRTCRIDSRPSDAINIQQRLNAPIYTTREIIDRAGVVIGEYNRADGMAPAPCEENEFSSMNIYDLKEMLDTAVKNEEYEMAAKIHAEIKTRTAGK